MNEANLTIDFLTSTEYFPIWNFARDKIEMGVSVDETISEVSRGWVNLDLETIERIVKLVKQVDDDSISIGDLK